MAKHAAPAANHAAPAAKHAASAAKHAAPAAKHAAPAAKHAAPAAKHAAPAAKHAALAAARFALQVAPYLAIFELLQVVGVPSLELGAWCLSIAGAVALRIASFAAVLVLEFPCLVLAVCCLPIAARAVARAPPEPAARTPPEPPAPAPAPAHDASLARALKRAVTLPRRARTRGDTGCRPKAVLPQALAGLAEFRSEVSPARACLRMLFNLAIVGAVMGVLVFGLFSVTGCRVIWALVSPALLCLLGNTIASSSGATSPGVRGAR